MAAIVVLWPVPALAGCNTKACEVRVAKRQAVEQHGIAWCHRTWRCVSRYYQRHPMPACTWVGESGGSWTARNPRSTAGGKYQALDSTWHAYGGTNYPGSHDGAQAPALEQELVARRILWRGYPPHTAQGLTAWVNC